MSCVLCSHPSPSELLVTGDCPAGRGGLLPIHQCGCVSSGETKARMRIKNCIGQHRVGVGTALAHNLLWGGQLFLCAYQRQGTISALRLMAHLRATDTSWAWRKTLLPSSYSSAPRLSEPVCSEGPGCSPVGSPARPPPPPPNPHLSPVTGFLPAMVLRAAVRE